MNIKSFFIRKIVNSEPILVIENGEIINENVKKVRLTIDSLMMLIRKKNAFNIADVESAVFEIDGKLSVFSAIHLSPE